MNYKIEDAISRVRQIVQDSRAPYRHSDESLIGYFNDALADVRRLRPDLFIGSLDSWTIYDSSNMGDDLPVDFTYFSTLVDYVSSVIGTEDDEYAVDGRAAQLHQRFIRKLTGKFA